MSDDKPAAPAPIAVPATDAEPIAPNNVETTFGIIKPDARHKAPEIILKAQEAGFTVLHSKTLTMTAAQASNFYGEHHGKSFYSKLVDFMTSGESVLLALQKDNAVADWRTLIGPTNSATAREQAPDSLRALFGTDNTRNACHGSSSVSAALLELSLFFPKYFLLQRSVAITMPGLSDEAQEEIEAQFTAWGFKTLEDTRVELDVPRARVLAEQWAAELPYEADPHMDEGSFVLPYLMRPHAPGLDDPPKEKKEAVEGEEPPAEEEAAADAEAAPSAPETQAMDVEQVTNLLASGKAKVYLLGRYGAVHALQCLTGPQDPAVARFAPETAGTLRGKYAGDRNQMAVHSSANAEMARKEIKIFFPEAAEEQLTLAIIKPDAVAGGSADTIRRLILANGFKINDECSLQMTASTIEEFYGEHIEKPFFPALKEFMTGGKAIALALSRVGAISMWRGLIGPTNTDTARETAPLSLRALFGTDGTRNACHGSDAPESGAREINILLPKYFKQESTLCLLKPDLSGPNRHKILKAIRDEGFFIQDRKRVQMSLDEAKSFYGLPGTTQGADLNASAAHLASGPIDVLTLSRPNAIRYWQRLLGPSNAKVALETFPNSFRGLYAGGDDDVLNAAHGSDGADAAGREIGFFFPRLVRSSKPPAGQVPAARFVEVELQPTLTKALTQLCKEKPPDPLRWLSAWLLQNNPNKPTVTLPPKVERRPRGLAQATDGSAGAMTMAEVVFLMGPVPETSHAEAKLLEHEFGFAHLDMAVLVEEEKQTGSAMAQELIKCTKDKEAYPYDILITLMKRCMELSPSKKFCITGYPTNIAHVRGYEKLMGGAPKILHLEPEGGLEALRESADATGEASLDAYEEDVKPCIDYYRKKNALTSISYAVSESAQAIFQRSIRKLFFKTKAKHFIYLLGPDAVGRQAVAEAIQDEYDFRAINLGALIVDEMMSKSPTGVTIKNLLKGKRPVTTSIIVQLLKTAIEKDSEKNFVIDGFPMNLNELSSLEKALGISCDAAVHLKASEETVESRNAAETGENVLAARTMEQLRGAGGLAEGVLTYLKEEGKYVEVDGNQIGIDIFADVESSVLQSNFKKRSKKVFVLGGPGSGKGTQCQHLVEKYGFVHLSAGDLLRAEVKSGSPHGAMISEMIRNGKIVPAEITVGLLQAAMDASQATRFLIDGFPRDMANVAAWEKQLGAPEFVLAFDCPEEELERRLLKRGETSGRSDDNLQSIKKRFKTFVEQSTPAINYYEKKGLVRRVSAMGSVAQVSSRTDKSFGAFSTVPEFIFVLGGPGAGKGTQCAKIADEYGFVHLSSGDLLRAEIANKTKIGSIVAGMIRDGKLVPTALVVNLMRAAMDARPGSKFLIDGFPRAMDQATYFEEMVGPAKMVLFYDAPDEELVSRLLERGKTSGRADDNGEAIKKRLETYHEQSQPVIEIYEPRGLLKTINALQSVDQVFADTQAILSSFKKQQIVLIFGQPLSGKTLLCKSLARTGMFSHISMNELLRAEAMTGTDVGREIANSIRSGKPVPGDIIVRLITSALAKVEGSGKIIIDGFPRNMTELTQLTAVVGQPHSVLYLDCADSGLATTLARNAADPEGDKSEDAEAKLTAKYEKFASETMEVVASFEAKGLLKKVTAVHYQDEDGQVAESGAPVHSVTGTKLVYDQVREIYDF